MEIVRRLWEILWGSFARLISKPRHYTNKYVDVIPETLDTYIFYIEGTPSNSEFAGMLCPCGCREEININLNNNESPYWKLADGHKTDLHPSIWKTSNCKSHFFLKKGIVKWC